MRIAGKYCLSSKWFIVLFKFLAIATIRYYCKIQWILSRHENVNGIYKYSQKGKMTISYEQWTVKYLSQCSSVLDFLTKKALICNEIRTAFAHENKADFIDHFLNLKIFNIHDVGSFDKTSW